jgi:hypothetical protein
MFLFSRFGRSKLCRMTHQTFDSEFFHKQIGDLGTGTNFGGNVNQDVRRYGTTRAQLWCIFKGCRVTFLVKHMDLCLMRWYVLVKRRHV